MAGVIRLIPQPWEDDEEQSEPVDLWSVPRFQENGAAEVSGNLEVLGEVIRRA